MKIEEQVLSIEQMKHLQELGVDTSDTSMCWLDFEDNEPMEVAVFVPQIMLGYATCKIYPTYTIGDLIEKLPKRIPHKYKRFIDVDLFLYPHIGLEDDGTITETMQVAYQAYGVDGKGYWHDFPHEREFDLPLKDRLYYALCYIAENYKELLEVKK